MIEGKCVRCGNDIIKKIKGKKRYCSPQCAQETGKEKYRALMEEAKLTGFINGIPYSLFYFNRMSRSQVKHRREGLLWLLPYDYFMDKLWRKPCYYCGSKIANVGIDRVDSGKSYEIGNVVPCCWQCNVMKHTQSQKGFFNQCKAILKHQRDKRMKVVSTKQIKIAL